MKSNGWTSSVLAGVVMAAFVVGSAATLGAAEPVKDGAAPTGGVAVAPVVEKPEAAAKPAPRIQVALLLDTSGSMSGLIKQAQAQLWKIVNEYATMKKDGLRAEVEVALIQYGSGQLPAGDGYMRLILPLSRDLDKASQELFALTSSGSVELCGQAIQTAVARLEWSTSSKDLKAIFIAGNEEFTQGSVDYRAACKAAIAKGIVVHTIYCGDINEGANSGWKDGAALADGSYIAIDQNSAVATLAAPQDKEIAKLGEELNKTYVSYGAEGEAGKKAQEANDANATTVAPSVAAERVVTKSSAQYVNVAWDLIDAVTQNAVKLEEVKVEELPKEMQTMTLEQRKDFVTQQAGRRAEIQKQVADLNVERLRFLSEKEKEAAAAGSGPSLGAAVTEAAASQAAKEGFAKE